MTDELDWLDEEPVPLQPVDDEDVIFTCEHCGETRSKNEDGGVIMTFTPLDGSDKTVSGICGATPECWKAAMAKMSTVLGIEGEGNE